MSEEVSDLDARRSESYMKQRETLIELEAAAAERFDNKILAYSTGAIALSVTFLHKIAPNPAQESMIMLILSWEFFILAVALCLLSQLTSQAAMRLQRDILDAIQVNMGNSIDETNRYNRITNALNNYAVVLFIGGVIAFMAFAIMNVGKGNHQGSIKVETVQTQSQWRTETWENLLI